MILGVIADDFTGATDVASMLVRAGMHTVQVLGVPAGGLPQADAVVVALKTRTVAPAEAVAQSLTALAALRAAGARQIYFKYCSTFDSRPQGNIGPVTDALMAALGTDFTIACPAFPENGRTVFRGHLFVGDALLSDSGMRNHPLTPMTDANLVRVLQAQTSHTVGLLRHDTLDGGAPVTQARMVRLRADGVAIAVADAVSNEHLLTLAEACAELPLITAGSGVALGLPPAYARRGWFTPKANAADLDTLQGPAAVVSGSCSEATNAQVAQWLAAGRSALQIDPLALHQGGQSADTVLAQATQALAQGPVLVYATAAPESVRAVQQALGVQAAGELVENALARIAQGLVQAGVRRLVVAGGETSGAVVQALGVQQLRIGAPICPGVPWTQATLAGSGEAMQLALKSGNFGGVDFFAQALQQAGVAL
ncbi:MAG: four-carbon acid sugar kinase family protein [Hydrogenophaga sp.]|uniref:3-oxo-tetronate kinase n=1 Tax=Hydrogenophaga sp. TaxID=1904254 RepID=UPI002720159C|nr:3-oxo-tetronate kinase [Hydrogenophaga sp.]MDO9149569.1 four-carbon acid sugar kinase family protein [Hydrogenophaga sp.]MDO9605337.1 four-carbon acid sugar kinase family protein [Hydrogenophaga sp.]MDP2165675.1 four-carbon acid sugar kinase family protein [Hydrogenophaga sp.]MDP3475484.1 four-carbon acid sugar kinase family protein [Hydrogenophaga sp.]